MIKIALVGNPNCGKTTVFNELTGSTQYVGNWPGVTVEKKEGRLKHNQEIAIVDLPGIYSLSPYSLEEIIARDFLVDNTPDAILNIIDSTNLERNLYLTTQLIELGIPIVVVLNMMDMVETRGDVIDSTKLSHFLGCPVVKASANKGDGLVRAVELVALCASKQALPGHTMKFAKTVEKTLDKITSIISDLSILNPRWQAIKLLERDEKFLEEIQLPPNKFQEIDQIICDLERSMDNDSESILTQERYQYIETICQSCAHKSKSAASSASDKIDRIVTNRWLSIPIFLLIMYGIYYVSIQTIGSMTIDWVDYLFNELIASNLSLFLLSMNASDWAQGLVVDGIVAGVGSVLTFVPQIMILFLFLSLLEDCGYMARVAFIMDRLFRNFGLSGKSFVPMLIGSGCSVPAIMASRTVDNERDRKLTIILTPFIPCSAKLPVFTLFVGAFFPHAAWVGASMYLVGIFMVIISGVLLKKTKLFGGKVSSFVMEIPPYRMPTFKGVVIHMWERAKTFIIKAGTIIFAASTIVWILQSFNWNLKMVESSDSILASIGHVIAPFFAPLGFGNWQAAVAIVTGFLAKENVVATFGILFGLSEATEHSTSLTQNINQLFTPLSAYSFMIFTLLAAPCFAAIGAIKREMGSWKWTFIAIGYQTGIAYLVALLIFQIGTLFMIFFI